MSLRGRLLLMLPAVVLMTVGLEAWIVSSRTRSAFEEVDQQRTATLATQIRGQLQREGDEVANIVARVAASDVVRRITVDVSSGLDPALYVVEAGPLARDHRLDWLELLAADGRIILSAQWPAGFEHKRPVPSMEIAGAFLKSEEVQNGYALGLVAVRKVRVRGHAFFVIGGRTVDRKLLDSLFVPSGMYVWLSRRAGTRGENEILGPSVALPDQLTTLARAAENGREASGLVQISPELDDRATVQAFPLGDDAGKAAVLLVGSSRKPFLDLQRQIEATAIAVAGLGISLAVAVSFWVAARFSPQHGISALRRA